MQSLIVAAGVLIEHGAVLLTKRKAKSHLAGLWEFPGGKVETDEDPRDGLRRELLEELGIDVVIGSILEVTFHRYEEAERSILLLFYEVSRTENSPHPRALDVAAFRWARAHELPASEFPPADTVVLEKVIRKLTSL